MAIYTDAAQIVGKTPLLSATKYAKKVGINNTEILAKLESFNPAGSVKDRIALEMINDAERRGVLKPGSHIVEPTSGNTGIGIAAIGTAKGYKVTIVLPASLSVERRAMIQAYGAELLLTPGSKAIKGAIAYVEEWAKRDDTIVVLGQFTNPANPLVHYRTTGPEIWEDADGKVDAFVAGIGTGGTLSGVGKFLKEKNPDAYIVGVEPETSAILTGGQPGPHAIQGIGAGFSPETLDNSVYDEILDISDADSIEQARIFGQSEGVFVGISSGAALQAARVLASRPEFAGKRIAVVLPDNGDRYLSTKLGEFPEAEEVDTEN